MWYEDLSPYLGDRLLAVGWLEDGHAFPTGLVDPELYEKLGELCRDPWEPSAAGGGHACGLCLYHAERSDGRNLYVPAGDHAFIAPVLILHYMNAHHYRPPAAFCDAVAACPEMRSQEYRTALVRTGVVSLMKTALRNGIDVPSRSIAALRAHGLFVSAPWGSTHGALPNGVVIAKPSSAGGNGIPGYTWTGWEDGLPVDAPCLYLHSARGKWIVTSRDSISGSGDFVDEWDTVEEAVDDILDFYFGDPARMGAKRTHHSHDEPNDEVF